MKSGVYIRVGRQTKDILELEDKEFVQILFNELKAFEDGRAPSETLVERVLTTYLAFIKNSPDKRNHARVAALLTLEKMGRRFAKVIDEWNECLKTLNFKNENPEH